MIIPFFEFITVFFFFFGNESILGDKFSFAVLL